MILAGDTGGTKTVLALCDDAGRIEREVMFRCAEYPSLEAIIDVFAPPTVSAACFGVAGPVVAGTAKITNLPWVIEEAALARKLGAPVELLNDLQATALGTLAIAAESFAVLQAGAVPPHATIGVIAPGTGLGESMLVSDGRHYRPLPCEAGHADFAACTDEEFELFRYLQTVYGPHVSYERVLSGNGIGDLYGFCRARSGVPEPQWLTHELANGDRNAIVTTTALAGSDPCCVRALELFVDVLGAEAGNLALRSLAAGGVVIGGGIPPKILRALQTGALVTRFNDKGRFSGWMRTLSVRVSLEPRAALLGAAHRAAMMRT